MEGLNEIGKNRIVDIFKKHGPSISQLFFFESVLDRFDLFVEMLKCMPNLEHLIFYETTTPFTDVLSDDELPELTKLKTLELVESHCRIVKCVKRSKLKRFKLFGHAYDAHSSKEDAVLDLLKTQPQITTLAFRNIHYVTSVLFQNDFTDDSVKFQLTQLSLLDFELRDPPNDCKSLIKFLKPQAKSIEYLELGREFPDTLYGFVFAKFKNLKTLRLMINELPKDMEFYERLEELQSVTQLIFMDSPPPNHLNNGCPPSLKEFIRHVPNVNDLTLLESCDRGTLQFIASNLHNLKRLSVDDFNESLFGGLQFPNLSALCVQRLDSDVDWDQFTKINPDITELCVHIFAGFSDFSDQHINEFVKNATKNLRLQTLRIGSRFRANETFYQIIRENGTELKVIDLNEKCALESGKMDGIPALRFHEDYLLTSHDLQLWNQDDYGGRLPDIDNGGNWDDGGNFFDPFGMDLMDIDDYDEYDQQDDYDDSDDFGDEFDDNSDYDER